MKTGIETTEFQRAAAKIWSEDERAELISYIAHNPFAGDVIPGAKAVRKFRWQVAGRGKRGGARVIYYNWIDQDCVVLLTVYTKSTQSNMAASDMARRRNDERKNTDSS